MILNAPSFFNSVFALVKPMLNEATKKKIDLLPVANVGEEMLKVIPSEHLPLHYGGTGEVRTTGSLYHCRAVAACCCLFVLFPLCPRTKKESST